VIHPRWYTKVRDTLRLHPNPDVRFSTYKTVVDFLISLTNDPQLGMKVVNSLPREIFNVYLAEQHVSTIKTPLPGGEFKISLEGENPYTQVQADRTARAKAAHAIDVMPQAPGAIHDGQVHDCMYRHIK